MRLSIDSARLLSYLCPRRIHDDDHSNHAENRSNGVVSIRSGSVETPAPEQREYNEHRAIGRIDAAKVSGLEGGDDAVQDQDGSSGEGVSPGTTLPKREPNEVSTADFTESREAE